MALRTGIDIIYIPKLAKQLSEGYLNKVLNPSEQTNLNPEHLAGKIAAKEAFFKAINHPLDWLAIELEYEPSGRPKLNLSETYDTQVSDLDITISHDHEYAIASVIVDWEGNL